MEGTAYTYILASRPRRVLYVGVTGDLERRVYQHRNHLVPGFASRYHVSKLVWFAQGTDILEAIALEKKIKNRGRQWKIDLIERENPRWDDLSRFWA